MPDVWFTSDLHLGHRSVIEFCNRPFDNVDHMDQMLIRNWNDRVHPGDRVYVLGDFSFHSEGRTIDILNELQGQKYLIWGNHDKHLRNKDTVKSKFVACKDIYSVKVDGQHIVCCHFPMVTWDRCHHGSWHLHGHSHGGLSPLPGKRIDVGVDSWDYKPVSFREITVAMRKLEFASLDSRYDDE